MIVGHKELFLPMERVLFGAFMDLLFTYGRLYVL